MPAGLRTFAGVVAGFLVLNLIVIVATLTAVSVLHQNTGHPTAGYLVFNVAYSFVAALAAGFVAALVDAFKPYSAAGILAAIMLAFGVVSLRHYAGVQPGWYKAMMVVVPPLLVLGGAAIHSYSARRHAA